MYSDMTSTSRPTITHNEYHSLQRRVAGRVEEAEEEFNEHAYKYGISSALDQKAPEVRKAQGYDDYTRKLRQAVNEFVQEMVDGPEFEVDLNNFEKAVKAAREKIESDSLRNWTISEPGSHEDQYCEGRLQAMNAIEYCESLIEDLK